MIFESKTPEYFERVQSLQYLDNKDEFLQEDDFCIQNGLVTIIPYIEQDGFHYTIHPEGCYLFIQIGNGRIRTVFNYDYGINNNAVIHRLFDNKVISSYLFTKHQFRTAKEINIYHQEQKYYNPSKHTLDIILETIPNQIGFPCIIKPKNGSFGMGVQKIHSLDELTKSISSLDKSESYIIQEFCTGKDYRIIYLDGEIIVAYERQHPTIIGDGTTTIDTLIQQTKAYEINEEGVKQHILSQGLKLHDILDHETIIQILPTANIASGGTINPNVITTQEDVELLHKISHLTGARYFGIDILSDGLIHEGIILEINRGPWIDGIGSIMPEVQHILGQKIRQAIKTSEGILD